MIQIISFSSLSNLCYFNYEMSRDQFMLYCLFGKKYIYKNMLAKYKSLQGNKCYVKTICQVNSQLHRCCLITEKIKQKHVICMNTFVIHLEQNGAFDLNKLVHFCFVYSSWIIITWIVKQHKSCIQAYCYLIRMSYIPSHIFILLKMSIFLSVKFHCSYMLSVYILGHFYMFVKVHICQKVKF